GDEKPIECRFADTLKPAFEKTKKELSDTVKSEEDVLSYIAFPQVAEKYFEDRRRKEENVVSYTIEAVE
ncbi:MAG: oxaloacetate decarboxylase subunit alpha, partial [Christensenellales bacterium]